MVDGTKWQQLDNAIANKSKHVVEELLKHKNLNVNDEDNRGKVLHSACEWSDIPIHLFNIILQKSADINAREWLYGDTALHIAINNESEIMVDKLLKHKDVDIHAMNDMRLTELHYACEWSNIPIHLFKLILEKTADINAKDYNGDTALHIAIDNESKQVLEELLNHKGLDVNVKNNDNLTALHLASCWPNFPIHLFKIILQKSTDINAKDNDGGTALNS